MTSPASAPRASTVERAFELSRLGAYENLRHLILILKAEHHESVEAHLAGPSIRRELRRLRESAGSSASVG